MRLYRVVLSMSFLAPFYSTSVTAQTAPSAATAAMTNDDVISLAVVGLSDDVIIAKIRKAPSTSFDTSIAGLKALKTAGVSSPVIRVMVDPSVPAAGPGAAAPALAADPNDPATMHAPGIYMMTIGADGKPQLSAMGHVVPKAAKTSGLFTTAITDGIAKSHIKVIVDGPKADLQTPDHRPVFYIYIREDNSTFGGSAVTIKDFVLVKFDAKSKTREINTASMNVFGSQAGVDKKARQAFTSEAIKPGVYKITLADDLKGGEYAFQQSGATTGSSAQQNTGSYFDFGVIPTKKEKDDAGS